MDNIEIKVVDGIDVVKYIPQGVCSKLLLFKIKDDTILEMEAIGGCSGNLRGIGSIVVGMKINDVTSRFSGIPCGNRPTSCPDQISKALEAYTEAKQHAGASV